MDRNRLVLTLAPLVFAFVAGARGQDAHSGAAPRGHAAPWSYGGDAGPAHWGDLDTNFALCARGQRQSPIDLVGAAPKDLANPRFAYRPSIATVVDTGHSVQVDYEPGSSIELDGETYTLAQFHFHSPSEHHLAGRSFPGELHLVHKDARGRLAVVGVLLAESAENPAFAPILAHLPGAPDAGVAGASQVNAAALLPSGRASFRYDGSLTTPPCSEGVRWVVLTEPVELSAAQLAALASPHRGNSRPVQPLDGRAVVIDSTP